MRNIRLVEIAAEFGAGTRGASLGVDAMLFACMKREYARYRELPSVIIEGDPEKLFDRIQVPSAKRIELITEALEKIQTNVRDVLLSGEFPLVISGDHSNAAGTVTGIKVAYPDKRLGVIWIDAHGDLHTPYTSPSGNVHGMPMAAMLNLGGEGQPRAIHDPVDMVYWELLCSMGGIAPKVSPEDIVYIGIRDLEQEEWDVVNSMDIRYFDNHKVNSMGAREVAKATLKHLAECDILYVSFDIDSIDGGLVPGTGTPVPDGLSVGQARQLLVEFWRNPRLVCMEFTEINPLLDSGNRTADIAADLLMELLNQQL